MNWTTPEFSRGQVDAAGKLLASDDVDVFLDTRENTYYVINNWRASHGYPLQALKMNLLHRAQSVDMTALVAQRLKRLISIEMKLRRNRNMKLSQMQDIGGCRAVLRTIGRLDALVERYEWINEHAGERSVLVEKYDYVNSPKRDGYRGVHLVYKFHSNSTSHATFNGLRIEIQLRSRPQHAWATAVETVDIFTKQALKAGAGSKDWSRFFALMGSAMAMREHKTLVPSTPTDDKELVAELRHAAAELRVVKNLASWSGAIRSLPGRDTSGAKVYLLQVDPEAGSMQVTGFKDWTGAKASNAYLNAEKALAEDTPSQAVLVSVQSLQALRSSYPNYFADTRAFLGALHLALE